MPIPLRTDFDASALRSCARKAKDGPQARRLLALAAIYDGATRTEAAKIGDVTLQIVRDWVMKFNANGPDGLIDRKSPGQPSRLNDAQRAAIAAMVDSGPIPAIHGVVRWRVVDLCQWVFEEFRVIVAKQTLSRELRAMGYRKLSARPRHHAQAEGAIEEYKKRMARPVCKGFFEIADDQSAATYPASEVSSQPRWRYARSRPHKLLGVKRRFLYQASRTPFDCQAISLSPLANIIDRSVRSGPDRSIVRPPRAIP
jgi:transposase